MYLFGITRFNTMILIPWCENCKLCTYWYHLVWVFAFLMTRRHPQNPKLPLLSFSTCCWPVESSMCLCFYPQPRLEKQIFDCSNNKTNTPTKQKTSKTKQTNKQIDRKKTEESVSSYMTSIGCSSWPEEEPKPWKSQATSGDKQQQQQLGNIFFLRVYVKIFPSSSGMLLPVK